MLAVRIVCIGKLGEKFWKQASAEYEKRLEAFLKLEIMELSEQKLPKAPSQGEIQRALEKEKNAIVSVLLPGSFVVAMCIEGKMMDSEALEKRISSLLVGGISKITIAIGGSNGMHEEIKQAADLCLSMSEMTFPHQFARIMVLEQLYRIMMMRNGNHYHK